jgi:hypothetical protein
MQAWYEGTDKKLNRLNWIIPLYTRYQKHNFQPFGFPSELARSMNL